MHTIPISLPRHKSDAAAKLMRTNRQSAGSPAKERFVSEADTRVRLRCQAAFAAFALAAALAHAQSEPEYRIAPHTLRQVTLDNGLLQHQPPTRLVVLGIEPVVKGGANRFLHRIPAASGEDSTVNLAVRELSLIDVDLARRHPFEQPFKRVLIYWGCGDAPGEKQPRAFRTERDDDARISARLAPSPTDSRPRSLREIPVAQRLVVREDIRFPERSRLTGVHEIRRGSDSSSFEVAEGNDFLGPVEISRVWVSDAGSVRVQWKPDPAAAAYFVNSFVQHKHSPDVVIWTSSRVPEAGWILAQSHPGAEHVAKLRSAGVLLGADTDHCTVPAAVARHAVNGMVVQVHAYAPEVQVASRSSGAPAVGQVKIAPRATSSVFLQTPFRHTSSGAPTMRDERGGKPASVADGRRGWPKDQR